MRVLREHLQERAIPSANSLWTQAVHKLANDPWGMTALAVVLVYLLLALGVVFGLWGQGWAELLNDEGYSSVTAQYWFGTNFNGQDIFARTLYSTYTAFSFGLSVSFVALFLGSVLGGFAGFYNGKWTDHCITWLCGCFDAMPFYLFVAAIAFAMKESSMAMHVAMISTLWTSSCKVVRGQVIQVKNLEFVEAARALGLSDIKIIFRHILPNIVPVLLVELTLTFVTAIKTEAILSFLGIGMKDGISWGLMLAEAGAEIHGGHIHNFAAASGFMFVLVMAINQFADALQDAFDPKKVLR